MLSIGRWERALLTVIAISQMKNFTLHCSHVACWNNYRQLSYKIAVLQQFPRPPKTIIFEQLA